MSERRVEDVLDLDLLRHDLARDAAETALAPTLLDRDPVTSLQRRVRARSRAYRASLPHHAAGRLPAAPAAVLDRLGRAREAVTAAQVAELDAAVEWAALHTTVDHGLAPGGEVLVAVAGDGAPLVAEFAIPELALRLGVSTDSGRALLGDAVELAHRLPGCWQALHDGDIAVFKARRVAQATRTLTPDAATYVDTQVAPYLHAIGTKALDGIIEAAIWRHDLPRALEELQQSLDQRGVHLDLDAHTHGHPDATVALSARLDRADALELDHALSHLAHQLHLAGSTDTLDVRRAHALGMLARHETPPPAEPWDQPQPPQPPQPVPARRRHLVLHVHLSETALRTRTGLARLEGRPAPVSAEQVRGWCTAPGTTTQVTVRPVIDLDDTLTTGSYETSPTLAEQVALRDRTCVFPHCTRNARHTDHDHVTPHATGGTTSSDNIAALCRRHHRLKTHHPGWTYRMLHPGTYLWTTPHHQHVLRDPTGTFTLR